jgi:hypothetical protein
MLYKKVCPIDSKIFYARKISTIYCSKTCANRTRYLPRTLVARLVASVQKYAFDEREYHRMATDNNVTVPIDDNTIDPKAIADLELLARENKRQQDLRLQHEEKEKQKSLESDSGFSVVESPADMSTEALQAGATAEIINIEPKKYKIRPIVR